MWNIRHTKGQKGGNWSITRHNVTTTWPSLPFKKTIDTNIQVTCVCISTVFNKQKLNPLGGGEDNEMSETLQATWFHWRNVSTFLRPEDTGQRHRGRGRDGLRGFLYMDDLPGTRQGGVVVLDRGDLTACQVLCCCLLGVKCVKHSKETISCLYHNEYDIYAGYNAGLTSIKLLSE